MNLRPIHRHRPWQFWRTRQTRQARRGMVLFEVVMALFIFTLVAFSLVMALDSAFDAAMDRNEIEVAIHGLANQMALLHAARVLPGEQDMPDDGSGILYHLAVVQPVMQDQKNLPVANMYSVTITATWKSRAERRRSGTLQN